MSKIFHVTTSQGRADTFYLQAENKNKVLTFLNTVSTAIVRNIKELVYSKTYDVNNSYSPPFQAKDTFYKVVVFAYSKTYSDTFTLYNVKKTITVDELKREMLKLYIIDEPIIGFFNIDFYKEMANDINIDFLYQVQYKRNSKTYVEDFYADSYQKVKDFFESVIDGELIEIRKYVHLDKTVLKDDSKDYIKRMNIYLTDDKRYFSISIPKIRKGLDTNLIKNLIVTNLDLYNKKIDSNNIKLTFR